MVAVPSSNKELANVYGVGNDGVGPSPESGLAVMASLPETDFTIGVVRGSGAPTANVTW